MRSEAQDQCVLADYLDTLDILWMHVPNGEATSRRGSQAKAMGAKPGCPDIWIITPPPNFSHMKGAVIELKRADKTYSAVSKEQREWLSALREMDWLAVWATYDMALDYLDEWGYI